MYDINTLVYTIEICEVNLQRLIKHCHLPQPPSTLLSVAWLLLDGLACIYYHRRDSDSLDDDDGGFSRCTVVQAFTSFFLFSPSRRAVAGGRLALSLDVPRT